MAYPQAKQELVLGQDYWLGTDGLVRTFIGEGDGASQRGEFPLIPRVYGFVLDLQEGATSMAYVKLDGADLDVQHGRRILDKKGRKDFGQGYTVKQSIIRQLTECIKQARESKETVQIQRREITPITSLEEIGALAKGDVIGIYCDGAYPAMVLDVQKSTLELAYSPAGKHAGVAMQQQFRIQDIRLLPPGMSVTNAAIWNSLRAYKGNTDLLKERGIFFRENSE